MISNDTAVPVQFGTIKNGAIFLHEARKLLDNQKIKYEPSMIDAEKAMKKELENFRNIEVENVVDVLNDDVREIYENIKVILSDKKVDWKDWKEFYAIFQEIREGTGKFKAMKKELQSLNGNEVAVILTTLIYQIIFIGV